jgi:hypothetical protein
MDQGTDVRHRIIYVLVDPRNREIRYVGQTVSGLKRRRAAHVSKARNSTRNLHVYNWLRQLDRLGLYPLIEEVESGEWTVEYTNLREAMWIAAVRESGSDLTNLHQGGGNYRHQSIPPEVREKIGAQSKRMWQDQEYRDNWVKSRKAYWKDNERARAAVARQTTERWADPDCKARKTLQSEEYRALRSEIAKTKVATLRRECLECGYVSRPPTVGWHQKRTGHEGIKDLAPVTVGGDS